MVHEPLRFRVECPCGRWHWREIITTTAPGLVVAERRCPRCGGWHLIVKRVEMMPLRGTLVGVVPSRGRDGRSLRHSLAALDLRPSEVELLVEVALLFSEAEARG